jgi:hypothetical protein
VLLPTGMHSDKSNTSVIALCILFLMGKLSIIAPANIEKSAANACNEHWLIVFDNISSISRNNSEQSLTRKKYSKEHFEM